MDLKVIRQFRTRSKRLFMNQVLNHSFTNRMDIRAIIDSSYTFDFILHDTKSELLDVNKTTCLIVENIMSPAGN